MAISRTDSPLADYVVADAERLELFRLQVVEYCSHLDYILRTLEEPISSLALASLVQGGHRRFSLRCHLAEHVVLLATDEVITSEEAVKVMRYTVSVLPFLFEKTALARERVNAIRFGLGLLNPEYFALLSIVHDANWSEGRPDDKLVWHYARTRGPSITVRCNPPVSPGLKVKLDTALFLRPRIVLTQSQEAAAARLTIHYRLHQKNACLSGYSLRPALLAGPSGVGKTALARHMAMALGRPLLAFDMGAWAPQGSRIEVSTVEVIRRALRQHEEGILLYIDEIDKFTVREQSWYASLNQEIYSLIDGRTDGYSGWDESDRETLARSFLFAGGTFQHRFKQQQRNLGFRVEEHEQMAIDFADDTIPDELLFRFSAPIVILPPTANEFAERIVWIHGDLGLEPPDAKTMQCLVVDAVGSFRGNRWLENYAGDLLIDRESHPHLERPEIDPTLLW